MKAFNQYDLVAMVVATDVQGGISVSPDLQDKPISELRVFNNTVRHLSSFTSFYIDDNGVKRVQQVVPSWPTVTCSWNDTVFRENGVWLTGAAADLAKAKDDAKTRIDRMAEAVRLKVITPGAGQLATYLAQYEEAKDILAGGTDPSPYCSALVGIVASTLSEVAQIVKDNGDDWTTKNVAINAVRMKAKNDVDSAGSIPAVMDVVKSAPWPSV